MKYQGDQGTRWPWLPVWWPGNSRTPVLPEDYILDYRINGQHYPRWPGEPSQMQHDWRWCHKCGGLFWAGGGPAAGRCAAVGAHERGASSDYALLMDMADAPGQHDWRWCHKCGGLFWAGGGPAAGTYPAGGPHERGASSAYALLMQ